MRNLNILKIGINNIKMNIDNIIIIITVIYVFILIFILIHTTKKLKEISIEAENLFQPNPFFFSYPPPLIRYVEAQ